MMMLADILTFGFFALFLILGLYGLVRTGAPRVSHFQNTNEKNRQWLADHLIKAKDHVFIVSGNLNPSVYNPLVNNIKNALSANSDLNIKIITMYEYHKPLGGENELVSLIEKGEFQDRLSIKFLNERPRQHFRVIDSKYVFVEEPHLPGGAKRMVHAIDNSFFKSWMYRRAFDRLWQYGEEREPNPKEVN